VFGLKLKVNQVTVIAFCIFYFCIAFPVSIVFILTSAENFKKEKNLYMDSKTRQAEKIEETYRNQLCLIEDAVASIFNSRWLSRLTNHKGIYDHEFDLYKKWDVIYSIRQQLQSMEFVDDIIVHIPQKDICISTNGWFKVVEASGYYPDVDFSVGSMVSGNVNKEYKSDKGIINLMYKSLLSKDCYIFVLVNVDKMDKFINNASLEQFSGYEILMDDKTVLQRQLFEESNENRVRYSSPIMPNGFRLHIMIEPYQYKITFTNAILVYVFILISGFFAALFLSYSTTKPIIKIINRLFTPKEFSIKSDYLRLPEYVDKMIANNSYLTKQLERYQKIIKNEFLFRLLINKVATTESEAFIDEVIPWTSRGLPFRILLFVRRKSNSYVNEFDIHDYIISNFRYYCNVAMPNCDIIYIIWYEDPNISDLMQFLDFHKSNWYISLSEEQTDISKISELYLNARNKLDHQMKLCGTSSASDNLPLSQEIDLIIALQENKLSKCIDILLQLFDRSKSSYNYISYDAVG